MSDVLVRSLAVVLACVFLWAAASKVVLRSQWVASLGVYGLGGAGARAVAWVVPLVETMVAGALLVMPVRAAAAAYLATLGIFSLGLLRARLRRGARLPCGCFGRTKERDYRVLLARNGVLGLLAGVIMVRGGERSILAGANLPGAGEVLPAVLVASGLVVVGWTLIQVGTLFRNGK